MGSEEFWRVVRRRVMPALVSVAALLVSIAAVVFIVDTVRDDGGDGTRSAQRLDDLDRLPSVVRAAGDGVLLGIEFSVEDGAIVVDDVLPGSPADDAGIEAGDVIERVDGEPVTSGAELREAVAAIEPGADYRMTINRGGNRETLDVERPELTAANLEEFLDDAARRGERRFEEVPVPRAAPLDPREADGTPRIGVTTDDTDEGVRVASVLPGLGADEAGIEPGDLLLAINGEPIDSTQQLRELLADAESGDEVRLLIARDGNEEQVRVTLSPAAQTRSGFRFFGPDGEERGFELLPNGEGGFQFRGPDGQDLSQLLEGLPPDLQERLARIIEELIENGGISPLIPRGDGQAPSGA